MQPDTDTLATVLASVIASERSAEEIRAHTELPWDDVQAAVTNLSLRYIIRNPDGELHYRATQSTCSGWCLREGREMHGQEVVIDPQPLRWFCPDCWEERVERVRSIIELAARHRGS